MKSFTLACLLFAGCAFARPVTEHKRAVSSCYKSAGLTQYWIPKEGDTDMTNDGEIVTLSGSKTKELKTDDGKTIAKVSSTTYDKFQMEGTGLLANGVMVNLASSKDTFMQVDRGSNPYGLGSETDVSLVPWVSVASNDIPLGTKLYLEELDGVKLPDGKTHNGCVRVDDEGWSFDDCQIDFFVLQYSAYEELKNVLPSTVTVSQKECTIQNYVTSAVKKWAVL